MGSDPFSGIARLPVFVEIGAEGERAEDRRLVREGEGGKGGVGGVAEREDEEACR